MLIQQSTCYHGYRQGQLLWICWRHSRTVTMVTCWTLHVGDIKVTMETLGDSFSYGHSAWLLWLHRRTQLFHCDITLVRLVVLMMSLIKNNFNKKTWLVRVPPPVLTNQVPLCDDVIKGPHPCWSCSSCCWSLRLHKTAAGPLRPPPPSGCPPGRGAPSAPRLTSGPGRRPQGLPGARPAPQSSGRLDPERGSLRRTRAEAGWRKAGSEGPERRRRQEARSWRRMRVHGGEPEAPAPTNKETNTLGFPQQTLPVPEGLTHPLPLLTCMRSSRERLVLSSLLCLSSISRALCCSFCIFRM